VQRVVLERHVHHVLARLRHGLRNRDRHFTRLAETEAHATGAITDDGQCGETELTTALDDLGRAIDCNQLLEELVLSLGFVVGSCHFVRSC
jgi:hypothetical protein